MAISTRASLLTLLLSTLGLPPAVEAGSFRITDVAYQTLEAGDPGAIRIIVTGSATYRGKLDDASSSWLIQTFLNDSIGNDLEDWNNPDWWSQFGNNGNGIPNSGFQVHCDINCGADGAIQKCDWQDRSIQYKGRAGVAIYHQFGPEIDEGFAATRETECRLYTVGGTVVNLNSGTKPRDLILRNNSVDSLTVTKAGAFTFPTPLRDGSLYSASVLQQPWGQKCWIYGPTGSGTIDGEDVTDILVNCVNFCEAGVGVVPRPGDYAAAQANCRAPVLVDNGDGTVSDLSNNLVWSRDVMHAGCIGTKFYSGGYAACFDLVLGGRDDWEVPDVAQLQTLLPTCGGSEGAWTRRWSTGSLPRRRVLFVPPAWVR
jgi:hypothetical protein